MVVSVAKRRSRSEAALLGDGLPGRRAAGGGCRGGRGCGRARRPDQEGADAFALVGAVAGVVGVDVGLGEGGWPHARSAAQVRKVSAWMNRLRAYWPAVVRSGPAAALARIAGELVPQPELAQQPQVRVPGQAVQAAVQPRAELAQLLVGGGQHAAADQQVTQVGDGPPAGPGIQRLVGQRQLAGGQVSQQVADVRCVQPFQRGGRAGRGGQGVGQRFQRRGDGAGPVVQQPGGRPGHGARAAEPAAAPAGPGHAGFGAAPQAGELAGDPGAVPADPHAVAQAGQHPAAVPQPGQVPAAASAAVRHR